MMVGGGLDTARTYGVLRGETVSGEIIEVRAIELINATYGRTWTMVNATIDNQSLKLQSPHPDNALLINQLGGIEKLPAGTRIPDLLTAWGNLYNKRLPADSPTRLRAIRLDQYRWSGRQYADYSTFVTSWRKEL